MNSHIGALALCPEVHHKTWGRETWMVNNDLYCGKIFHMRAGFCSSAHYHQEKDETFFVLSGALILELSADSSFLSTTSISRVLLKGLGLRSVGGTGVRILPRTCHRFLAIRDTVVLEVSTPHKEEDVFRHTNSFQIDSSLFYRFRSIVARRLDLDDRRSLEVFRQLPFQTLS